MIQVTHIDVVHGLSREYLLVQFRIADTTQLSGYSFNLYRSNSPEAEFSLIRRDVQNFSHKDYGVNLQNTSVRYYYKVGIVDSAGVESVATIVGHAFAEPLDDLAFAILDQHNTFLEVVGNQKIHVFLKRRFGQRCILCWDDIRSQSKSESCTACFGTGYDGGYYPPIEVACNYTGARDGSQQHIDAADVGEIGGQLQLWIPNYPLVSPSDVLADIRGGRFVIVNVQPTYKGWVVLRQVLSVQKLPATHILYKLPM